MRYPLPLIVTQAPAEYSSGYSAQHLLSPESYWCTPSSPSYPQQMELQIEAFDALIERLLFDTRIHGYETSAASRVLVEAKASSEPNDNSWETLCDEDLEASCLNLIVLPKPTPAAALRLTFRANHGGPYLGLARFQVLGSSTSLHAESILLPGSPVEVLTPQGSLLQGTVERAGYLVQFDDGQPAAWLPLNKVWPRPSR